ncbi:MAG: bacteriohemerythrin [Piscinibacter sp.]|uniref:bacteriohemerythrin n=1 Tax=Piscinibacter sp. TaxID=1903157 RepID=UPI003D0CE0A5
MSGLAPIRAPWEPGFATTHAVLDTQHQALLAECDRMAGLCASATGEEGRAQFDQAFVHLKALVKAHFEAEAAALAACGCTELDDHRDEHEEFEYLADEIATVENFDRLELQRFLALWCIGHVTGSSRQLREWQPEGRTTA